MKRLICIVQVVVPLSAVVAVGALPPPSPGFEPGVIKADDCQTCVDGKKAPAGTTPDYSNTHCYPFTGFPPLLKQRACLTCLSDLCGNACAANHCAALCGPGAGC